MTDTEILNQNSSQRTKCERWTRVMGYYRPYSYFNKGKQSEYNERVWFEEKFCGCKKESEALAA